MPDLPDNPKIYHITHVNNLPGIVRDGCLWSDRQRIDRRLVCDLVGMSSIKQRRLTELAVSCHAGSFVGDYVPFYFCPRSIMLFILHRGNHPDVTYRGGQGPIVHLQADLRAVVAWANRQRIRWAYTNRNAGAYLADFYDDLNHLDAINWNAIASTDFRDAVVKDGKQAEFLLHDAFPWELVEAVGVQNGSTLAAAQSAIRTARHRPPVQVQPIWYY